jgi:hypothetical protein
VGDFMIARILFLVDVFLLPFSIMSQNLEYQSEHFPNRFQKNNLCITNNFSMRNDERSLYLIRITGVDKEDNIKFYGLSLGWFHQNPNANFSGLILCGNLGANTQAGDNISVNGLNLAVFNIRTMGTINGISISAIGNYARVQNGLQVAIIGTGADYLNGLTIGGIMSQSIELNGIQISLIINICERLNGIGISFINAQSFESNDKEKRNDNGLILGVFNIVDIKGLSIAALNSGNSWIQIGLVNKGESAVQIGLVNLHSDGEMGIPLINVNF